MRVVKQCGDLHVPMGATTFVALCDTSIDPERPTRVQNRQLLRTNRTLQLLWICGTHIIVEGDMRVVCFWSCDPMVFK